MTVSARAELLALVAALRPGHPDWDLDAYGGLLTDCTTRAIPAETVLMQTALAMRHGEGVREVREALKPKPWEKH